MEQFYKLFKESSGVCTDTRNIIKDSLFIALKGANFNGNEFVEQAIQSGAKFAITDEAARANNETIFYVKDTLKFLQELAHFHRNQFDIPVIGITGSNGKTTTKELLHQVLGAKFNAHATKGNLNNHIGVPLTLLELNNSHEMAIIEMGANKFGDIKELAEIASPTHGIITNIGKAHLEGFGSFEGVYKTKKELFDFIQKTDGTMFLNNDYPEFDAIKKQSAHLVTYGKNNSDINGQVLDLTPFVQFEWNHKDDSDQISTQLIGEYNFYNLLSAVTIGLHFNVEKNLVKSSLEAYVSDNNRSQIIKTKRNTIILDAYNANPSSMKSAIESFHKMNADQKLLILGDMFELGTSSKEEHSAIVQLTQDLKLNSIFVGKHFKNAFEESFEEKTQTSDLLNQTSEHLILIKGSRGMRLEELVELL